MNHELPSPLSPKRWGMLAFLMAIAFMGHFNRISISVAGTEQLKAQYQFSDEQLGLIYSSFVLMYTCFMAPGGWLIDRIGAVKALAMMGISFGVLEALTGLVSVFPGNTAAFAAFFGVRSIAGITSAPLHPGASRVNSRWMLPSEQPLANGMVTAAAVLGISSTFYLFGWLMDAFGWPAAFVIAGGMMLALMFAWMNYAQEHPVNAPTEEAPAAPVPERFDVAQTWNLLRNRNLVCLTLSYSAVGYFQYIFFFWIEHLFMEEMMLDKQTSRGYSTIALLSMAVGMLAGGWAVNRLSELRLRVPALALIPIIGMLTAAVSTIISGRSKDPEVVLFWFSLAMAGIGACEGPMWTLAVRMGRHSGGTAAGIFNTGGNIGGIISPALTPLIGFEYGLWIASLLCVIGAILWIGIDAREETEAEPLAELDPLVTR